jgi:cytochrome c peroxidase
MKLLCCALVCITWCVGAHSDTAVPALYSGADLQAGAQLIAQHKCAACHVKKTGGDGSAIYKPTGRINSLGLLRGMVEQCNTELNLGLFPDEVNSISAVLNRDNYRFE